MKNRLPDLFRSMPVRLALALVALFTVVSLLGPPEETLEAAFQAIRVATERIDMRKHTGAHARFGATDVCPFVPVRGLSMDD